MADTSIQDGGGSRLAIVEQVLVESAFQRAIDKLKWLLPFKHPQDREWNQLEDLSGNLTTTVLHDVVLDTFDELSQKHHLIPKHDPRKPSKTTVEKTMHDITKHVQLREVLERNQLTGNKLLELLGAGLVEYDLPEQERLGSLHAFIKQNTVQLQEAKNARMFKDRHRSDAEIDLSKATRAVDEAKNQLLANMEAYRLHERQIDNEVYDTQARVAVELTYTDDFTEHQLQFMAFVRDHEERAAYEKQMNAARRYECSAVMHRASKDLYKDMFDEQKDRHEQRMQVADKERERLDKELWQETRSMEELDNDLVGNKVAIQHHQTVINQLRSLRAEEVQKEQALLRYMNAVIRIQRWWRYHQWLRAKKKKRKGKKEKGKSKKGGKKQK